MRRLRSRRSKLVAAAAVAALALAASACSSSSGSAGGKTTLTVWTPYTGPAQLVALKAQDALFEKSHPNVTVEALTVGGSQMDPKLLAGVSTKSGPDVVLNNVVVDFPELVSGGILYNLTKDWNAYSGKSQFPAAGIWKNSSGQIYNVMSYTNLLGLYYNKTILDQYNLKPPTTMAEFVSDMQTVKAGGKYTPLAASDDPDVDGAWTWMPMLLGQNVDYCNLSGTKVTQAFQTALDWAQAGYIPKESATWTQSTSWTEFMSG
jgi:multiple sugar transport system substrate-binding protein